MSTDSQPIVVEQVYEVPIGTVWEAITDRDQMRRWYFDSMDDFRPEVGFETRFNVRFKDRLYIHEWKVTNVVPGHRLTYDFRYGGIPGDSSVTWELSEVPGGTRLRLTHVGQHTFPRDDPAFSRESCQEGWKHFLGTSLKGFLKCLSRPTG